MVFNMSLNAGTVKRELRAAREATRILDYASYGMNRKLHGVVVVANGIATRGRNALGVRGWWYAPESLPRLGTPFRRDGDRAVCSRRVARELHRVCCPEALDRHDRVAVSDERHHVVECAHDAVDEDDGLVGECGPELGGHGPAAAWIVAEVLDVRLRRGRRGRRDRHSSDAHAMSEVRRAAATGTERQHAHLDAVRSDHSGLQIDVVVALEGMRIGAEKWIGR